MLLLIATWRILITSRYVATKLCQKVLVQFSCWLISIGNNEFGDVFNATLSKHRIFSPLGNESFCYYKFVFFEDHQSGPPWKRSIIFTKIRRWFRSFRLACRLGHAVFPSNNSYGNCGLWSSNSEQKQYKFYQTSPRITYNFCDILLMSLWWSSHSSITHFIWTNNFWSAIFQAFCGPAFQLLSKQKGLIEHPDTIDDLFRLCGRWEKSRLFVCLFWNEMKPSSRRIQPLLRYAFTPFH